MDSTSTNRMIKDALTPQPGVTQPIATPMLPPKERVPEEMDLDVHKQRLRDAARDVDFLKPLRNHPFVTVGMAAALGVFVSSIPGGSKVAKVAASSTSLLQRLIAFGQSDLVQGILRTHLSGAAPAAGRVPPDGDPVP
ncbi:MAG: hypothetical protein H7144_06895 [Burkholderiales bacterium]|nr:hypothetical protein [Phycisphaerae bacterium]